MWHFLYVAVAVYIGVLISQYVLVSEHKISPAQWKYVTVQHASVACRAS